MGTQALVQILLIIEAMKRQESELDGYHVQISAIVCKGPRKACYVNCAHF